MPDPAAIITEALRIASETPIPSRDGIATLDTSGLYALHDYRQKLLAIRSRAVGGAEALTPDERKAIARYVVDMYEGNALPYLDKWTDETPEDFEKRPGKIIFGVSRCVTTQCTTLYNEPPKRQTKAAWGEWYTEWARAAQLDEHMQGVNSYGFVCGVLAVVALWDEDRKTVTIDIVTPDKIDVVENRFSPGNPHAVIVQWTEKRSETKTTKVGVIYTRDAIIPLTDGKPDPTPEGMTPGYSDDSGNRIGHVNPYQIDTDEGPRRVMPLSLWRFTPVSGRHRSFFVKGHGEALADIMGEVNQAARAMTQQQFAQAFSQMWIQGEGKERITIGPFSAVRVGSDVPVSKDSAGIGFVSPDDHIASHLMAIEWELQMALELAGLPKVSLATTVAQSGESIKAASGPLSEFRQSSVKRMGAFETDFAKTVMAVAAYHTGDASLMPHEDDTLSTDYPDPAAGITPTEQRQLEAEDVQAGYLSVADVMISRNPDLFVQYDTDEAKRDAAVEMMRENIELMREIRGEMSPKEEMETAIEAKADAAGKVPADANDDMMKGGPDE